MPEQVGSIVRVDHSREHPYVPVSRKTIRNTALDLEGLGFLVFLLAKPYDWRIRPDALARELKIGKATVYRMLDKLVKAGFSHHELIKRNNAGRFQTGNLYMIFEDCEYRREWADRQCFVGKGGKLGSMANDKIPF